MGGGASTGRQPLHALSADGVRDLVEGIGPSYSDLAKQLHELGYDGEFLAKASEDDLTEIFDKLEVPKLETLKHAARFVLTNDPPPPASAS